MQLAMPDNAVRGVRVEGARTGATTSYEGRIVTVDNPQHVKALRELGAFPVSLSGHTTASGYRCSCGFGSYFARCSRCGGTCTKEI